MMDALPSLPPFSKPMSFPSLFRTFFEQHKVGNGNTSWTPKPILDSTLSHSDLILSRNDQKPVFRYNALPSFYYLSLNVIKSRSIKMELPPFIVLYNLRKKINLLLNFYFHQISPAEQNRSTNFPNFPSLKYYRTKTIRTYLAV